MKHTVIALFDRHDQARRAAENLVSSGFDRTDVHVGDSDESATRAPTPPVHLPASTVIEGGTGIRGRLMNLLDNLFGVDDDEHVEHYGEAMRRGGALVSVHADDEAHAPRARDALLEAGAVNIDDRVEEWRKGGWEGVRPTERVSPEGRGRTVVHRQEASIGGVRVYGHAVAHEYEHYAADFQDDHAGRYASDGLALRGVRAGLPLRPLARRRRALRRPRVGGHRGRRPRRLGAAQPRQRLGALQGRGAPRLGTGEALTCAPPRGATPAAAPGIRPDRAAAGRGAST